MGLFNTLIIEKIKYIRLAKKIKQKDAAKSIGISPTFLCEIEKGRTNISLELAERIFNSLGCDIKTSIIEKKTKRVIEDSFFFKSTLDTEIINKGHNREPQPVDELHDKKTSHENVKSARRVIVMFLALALSKTLEYIPYLIGS